MRLLKLLAGLSLLFTATAWGNIQVYPTRLSLNDSARAGMLSVRNRGEKPETFRIVPTFFRMKPDGTLEAVTDPSPTERPFMEYVRFSPRNFTLAPQAEQVVRVLYSGSGDLAEGEYRCHLTIEPVAEEKKGAPSKGALKIVLEAKLAVAIPIFFRRGKPTYDLAIDNLHLVSTPDGGTAAVAAMNWTGNAYPFGEFHAMFSKGDSDPTEIGLVRGIAAYISPRAVTVPLSMPKEKLSGGKLRLEFRLPDTETAEKFVEAKIP